MTTVINTPPNTNRPTEGDSGWAVAVVILILVIGIAAFFWFSYRTPPATETRETSETSETSTNINVTIPDITPTDSTDEETTDTP